MNPRVKRVTTSSDYQLHIEFTNGERGVYDCSPILEFGVFKDLKDLSYFKQARVLDGTVAWPADQDICPDTLYIDSVRSAEQDAPADARTSRG
jgi:hypothetical protein